MAGETKIQGNALLFAVHDGTAYRNIACLTSNSLSSEAEIIETETKCNPGVVEKEYGAVNNSFDVEGQYIDTTSVGGYTTQASHDWLLAKQAAKEKVTVRMATGLADVPFKYATAIIASLELTGDVNEVATFTGTLEAEGLVDVDPHA